MGQDQNLLFSPRRLEEEGWAEVRNQLREFARTTQVKVWNSLSEKKLTPYPHVKDVMPQVGAALGPIRCSKLEQGSFPRGLAVALASAHQNDASRSLGGDVSRLYFPCY